MKQLRKTEWQKGYLIKKNLALCAWVLMLLAGFAGEYSIAGGVCPCLGGCRPNIAAPDQILQKNIP